MKSKDELSIERHGVLFSKLGAWSQAAINRLYRAQLPPPKEVVVDDSEYQRLAREYDALLDENVELWHDNEELKMELAKAKRGR